MLTQTLTQLADAGFTKAAENAKILVDRKRKLSRAYEHYRYVTHEQINVFKNKLKETTEKCDHGCATLEAQKAAIGSSLSAQSSYRMCRASHVRSYDTLTLTPTEVYEHVPPSDIVARVAAVKAEAIFDTFEVAHIVTERRVVDPIIFGRIDGCTDRFFIAQWGEDVSISDLLADHEG